MRLFGCPALRMLGFNLVDIGCRPSWVSSVPAGRFDTRFRLCREPSGPRSGGSTSGARCTRPVCYRASRCRMGSSTRSRWVRVSWSRPRVCHPTVRCHVYGTLLPAQPRRVQGQPVDGGVVGRHAPHPRSARTMNQLPQSKLGPLRRRSSRSPLGLRTTAIGCFSPSMDSQVSSTSTHAGRTACGSGIRPRAVLTRTALGVAGLDLVALVPPSPVGGARMPLPPSATTAG